MTVAPQASPELAEYERTVREWSLAEVRPHARAADTAHAPPANWREVVMTCPVPIGYRRQSGDMLQVEVPEGKWVRGLVLTEALAYGDHWVTNVIGSGIGHLVVKIMGTPEQVERWYDPIVASGGQTAFALTEPQFGSDTSMVATTATRDGETWVLNGTKMYCTYGGQADYVVVFATTDPSAGPGAIKAFLVPRGTPGFAVAKFNEDKLGIRSWTTSELLFDGCVIPLDHQLGWSKNAVGADNHSQRPAPSGRSGALGALAQNKPNISALGVGMTQAALDLTRALLVAQRAAFAPHRWSQVASDLDAMDAALARCRLTNLRAQVLEDAGAPSKAEASLSKCYGPPTFERIIRRCMQLLGPDGTSTDLLLEKWYRDVKILDIFEGSGQVQRIIIGRALFAETSHQR
jgi:acyl-CoA dehydrogenase